MSLMSVLVEGALAAAFVALAFPLLALAGAAGALGLVDQRSQADIGVIRVDLAFYGLELAGFDVVLQRGKRHATRGGIAAKGHQGAVLCHDRTDR
ncbi:hypothetical protein [Chitinolyticbacter meiyuanensis]|uniref:hypothetical protein n=1 Tax=Chitinolyticbacter meiyuanensis TaxID=682798 RepID=UPI0011E5DC49|nr:hypothetical protein [Chitinolyticbacter meiyuanensis]